MALASLRSRAVIGALMKRIEETMVASWIPGASMLVNSTQETETYVFAKAIAKMRQWIGERAAKQLSTDQVAVTSFEYEDSLTVSRRDRALDKTGQVDIRIGELASGAVRHWAQLLAPLLNNGSASVATYGAAATFDAANFFGNTHRGSQDNAISLAAASGTRPTGGEFVDMVLQAAETMMGFTDEQSEPMNDGMSGLSVIVPTALMGPMIAGLKAENVGDTVVGAVGSATIPNTLRNAGFRVTGHVSPRLTNAAKFFVVRDDSDVRALIRQEEEGLAVDAIAEGSEHEFKTGDHLYGVRATRGVGYGRWEHAVEVTVT